MPITYTAKIAGSFIALKEGSLQYMERSNGRNRCSFVVEDSTGTATYYQNQTVEVLEDGVSAFKGYIDSATPRRVEPNTQKEWGIECKDHEYLATKRQITHADSTVPALAGDKVIDLHQRYLAAEGVVANYASRRDYDGTTWGQGTPTWTTGANDMLSITGDGVDYSKTETTTADFATGTLTNVTAANNQLQLSSVAALKYTGTASSAVSNAYIYRIIWTGSQSLLATDALEYDVWISSTSPEIKAGVDGRCTDGTTFRDSGMLDNQLIPIHPRTDLSDYADDRWCRRKIVLNVMGGKTLNTISIAIEGDEAGDYTAYFKRIRLLDSVGNVKATFFSTTVLANQQVSNSGFTNISFSKVTAYELTGNRISTNYDISTVGISRTSLISWAATIPTQPDNGAESKTTPVIIETSLDNGATWQVCTSGQPIPNLIAGQNAFNVQFRQTLNIAGPDPTKPPTLDTLTFTVLTSYQASKNDVRDIDNTYPEFSTGTFNNIATVAGDIYIDGRFREWSGGDMSNQTVLGQTGGAAPAHGISYRSLYVRCDGTLDVRSKLDFAGAWIDFVAEVDLQVVDSVGNYGLCYRGAGGNGNNTYAYVASVRTTRLVLDRGSNTTSGTAASSSNVALVNMSFEAGKWLRLKVEVSGTNHKIYVDGTKYIDVNDATWTGGGEFALRHYNDNASGRHSGYFNNFGVQTNAFTGSRTTPALSLSSVGTVGNSLIQWDATVPDNTTMVVESSTNGTTWTPCTNGGTVASLTPGQNVASTNLQIRTTMTTANANATPVMRGLSTWVWGAFNATANRVSPALSIASIGRAGSSSIYWAPTTPVGTSVGVDVSYDGTTWIDVTGNNGGALPNMVSQPDPTIDVYTSNLSANYTSTFRTGGSVATWTYDTTNARLTSTGGVNALYVRNGVTGTDVDVSAVFDWSDSGGIIFAYSNTSNYYELVVNDSGAASPGRITLFEISAGTRTQRAQQTGLTITRGKHYTIRATQLAGVITAYLDGVQVLTWTDTTPLTGTQCGLRTDGNTSRFYQLRLHPYGSALGGAMSNVYTRVRLTSTDPTVTPSVKEMIVSVRGPEIGSGALISTTDYQYQASVAEGLDDLASKSSYQWFINLAKKLFFRGTRMDAAPWVVSSSNGDILVSSEPKMSYANNLYRNRHTVIGGFESGTIRTESVIGDGYRQTWPLQRDIASISTISINGVSVIVGVDGDAIVNKQFTYVVGERSINRDNTLTPLTSSDVVTITYYPRQQVVKTANNTTQQAYLASLDGSTGIVEVVEVVNDLDGTAAQQLADARLTQYGVLNRVWQFTTLRSGLHGGQLVSVTVPEYGLSNTLMLITEVRVSAGTALTRYDVTCSEGPSTGTWAQFFQ